MRREPYPKLSTREDGNLHDYNQGWIQREICLQYSQLFEVLEQTEWKVVNNISILLDILNAYLCECFSFRKLRPQVWANTIFDQLIYYVTGKINLWCTAMKFVYVCFPCFLDEKLRENNQCVSKYFKKRQDVIFMTTHLLFYVTFINLITTILKVVPNFLHEIHLILKQ